jgi:hypothetical protein
LLSVAPDDSVAFVTPYLRHADEAVVELAALALGESRLDAALPPLKEAWSEPLVADTLRRTLLRAAAAHRSEAAFDWLLAIAAEARAAVALEVIEALALYKHNVKLAARLEAVLAERDDHALTQQFTELWRASRSG